jgi:hypothetical protein
MISEHSIVAASASQVSCDLAGEAAILNLADGVYYGLDPVGASIWHMIQQPMSVEEICRRVMGEYDVEADVCHRDVVALLEQLAARGLIEVRTETSA